MKIYFRFFIFILILACSFRNLEGTYSLKNEESEFFNLAANQSRTLPLQSPLRILFVVGSFPLLPETFIINQITGLIDRGHDIWIYSRNHSKVEKFHADITNYHLLDRTYFGELPEDLADFDIIYCQFGPLGKLFMQIKKEHQLKAKLITCFRGYDLTREINEKGRDIYKDLFREGDLFFPVCEYFKALLIDLGCNPKKIIVHHSGIDLSRFIFQSQFKEKNQEIFQIVSVNRLVEKKGTKYAIEAIDVLKHAYPQIRYTVVGDGELRNKIEKQIKYLGLEGIVKLFGWATQDEVIKILKTANLFILPSVTSRTDGNEEGIPNALKEAMAMGVPVISTNNAGIPELITHGVSGLLVESRDSQGLAKQIKFIIDNSRARRKMILNARLKVEAEFDVNKINDRVVEIFRDLLKKQK